MAESTPDSYLTPMRRTERRRRSRRRQARRERRLATIVPKFARRGARRHTD